MSEAIIPIILCCGEHGRALVYGYVDQTRALAIKLKDTP